MAKVIVEITLTQGAVLRDMALEGRDSYARMAKSETASDTDKARWQERSDAMANVLLVLS